MKKFISLLLAAAITLLPFTTQAQLRPASRAQLDAFKARCVLNVQNNNTAALVTDFRRAYRVPADADVSVSVTTEPPFIYPQVALGCLVLVVVISVVVWGVVIYIVYQICTKPANGGTNTNN